MRRRHPVRQPSTLGDVDKTCQGPRLWGHCSSVADERMPANRRSHPLGACHGAETGRRAGARSRSVALPAVSRPRSQAFCRAPSDGGDGCRRGFRPSVALCLTSLGNTQGRSDGKVVGAYAVTSSLGVRGWTSQRRRYPRAIHKTPGPVVPLSPQGGRPTHSRKGDTRCPSVRLLQFARWSPPAA